MAEITVAGILRAKAFSPNHIGNDAAILNATADQLRKRGCSVNIYNEEQLQAGEVKERVILNMCREGESIRLLQKYEDEGRIVINSGYALESCQRERCARILLGCGIPYPESIFVDTNEAVVAKLNERGFSQCWIKQGDFHSKHKEDVTFVRHADEAQEILQEYFYRGITRAVISKHVAGNIVKFYGVLGTPFFFSLGSARNEAGTQEYDPAQLQALCTQAATELGVHIYGGDCIITPEGKLVMIDFNDWPSMAPCRNKAALHIAKLVLSLARKA